MQEAARLSLQKLAKIYVMRLPNGKTYSSEANPHLSPGKRIATFVNGSRIDIEFRLPARSGA